MAVLTTNPALNQRLMQLDREYEQQKANLMQSYYSQPQQMIPTQMSGTSQQPPQTNQGLLWVQGEAGAKSYLVAPNTTVLLMDSEGSRFYLKSTDNAGMPSLKIFEYTEVTQNTAQSSQTDLDDKYVTRAEYDALNNKYIEILDKLNSFPTSMVVAEDGGKSAQATNKSRNRGGNDNG
ncbi:MAG: hypothetical protein NC243_11260 [Lachnoclostridium sp.]|nr:hypothetical protein [Lachnoclostridium sp.]MCM1385106.1 hypothetical protein [Lachnoclostridium sp.]